MKFLLKLKAWQLFCIMFLPAMLVQAQSMALLLVIQSFFFLVWIGWVYAVGMELSKKLPGDVYFNKGYFEFSCFFVASYITVVFIFFPGGYSITQDNYKEFGNSIWVIVPLHLYMMASLIYIFYSSAKVLSSCIDGKQADFGRSFGYFMGFWFFPVGIWFIQPKVQNILNDNPY